MQEKQSSVADRLTVSIEELYRSFGAWKTGWALVRAVRNQRRAKNRTDNLSDRMLRDMGLPERKQGPLDGLGSLWEILR